MSDKVADMSEPAALYNEVVENSPTPIFLINAQGIICSMNGACEEFFNRANEKMIGRHYSILLQSQSDTDKLSRKVTAVFQNNSAFRGMEVTYQGLANGGISAISHVYPVKENGVTRYCAFVNTVLNNYRQFHQQLAQRQERLDLINCISRKLKSSMDMHEIIPLIIAEVGKRFPEYRTAYSIIDKGANLWVQHAVQPVSLPDISGTTITIQRAEKYVQVLRKEEVLVVPDITKDQRLDPIRDLLKRGGVRALVDVPIKHSDELLGLFCFDAPEVTEWTTHEVQLAVAVADQLAMAIRKAQLKQQRAEIAEKLDESRLRFKAIANHTYDWESWFSPDGELLWVNPAVERITGYTPEECSNMNSFPRPLIYEPDLEQFDRYFSAAKSGTSENDVEMRIVKKSGKVIPIAVSWQPIYDDNSRCLGHRSSVRDITRRKETEEAVKNTLNEKEILLSEVHHRVKNNLNIIDSLIELQIAHMPNERSVNQFRRMQNRIRSMALMHEQLYQSESIHRINLQSYLEDLLFRVGTSYAAGNVDMIFDPEDQAISLSLNRAILCGLIVNELVTNAFQHAFTQNSSQKDWIEVNLHCDANDRIAMVIADNGVGFTERDEPESCQSLGLRLVHLLVEQLNGQLNMTSEHGSTVTLTFPVESERG